MHVVTVIAPIAGRSIKAEARSFRYPSDVEEAARRHAGPGSERHDQARANNARIGQTDGRFADLSCATLRPLYRTKIEEGITSRLFAVTDTCSQLQLNGFGAAEIIEAWYYQPGKAVRALGNDARRVTIARAILTIDPRFSDGRNASGSSGPTICGRPGGRRGASATSSTPCVCTRAKTPNAIDSASRG